jgi:hypothetical protein
VYSGVGIGGASSHSGRRTFITTLANKGVGVRVLMALAGHRNIGMTLMHIDLNDQIVKVAVNLNWQHYIKRIGGYMRVKIMIYLFSITALSGCGVLETIDTAHKLSKNGSCAQAHSEIDSSILHISKKYLHNGAIYWDCDKDRETAFRYLTMSARYGDDQAIGILLKNNQPVPPQDLVGSSDVFVKALTDGLAKSSQNRSSSTSTSDTSCRRTAMGGMDCTTSTYNW